MWLRTLKREIALALSPAITLWNPYNHEMTLDNLYLEVPFSAHHGQPGSTSLEILSFDLNEYDLYRKWWAYMYDTNISKELSVSN